MEWCHVKQLPGSLTKNIGHFVEAYLTMQVGCHQMKNHTKPFKLQLTMHMSRTKQSNITLSTHVKCCKRRYHSAYITTYSGSNIPGQPRKMLPAQKLLMK